jgi:hypothetical protein
MSEEPIGAIELEEAEPVDGSFLDVIGYRLFHGNFLRFMSGIRNFGQVWDGTSERGFFDPLKSNVNCAVPKIVP